MKLTPYTEINNKPVLLDAFSHKKLPWTSATLSNIVVELEMVQAVNLPLQGQSGCIRGRYISCSAFLPSFQ